MPEQVDVVRLGRRLRRIRQERGVRLEQTSKDTGVSVATLSRIERGGSKGIDGTTMLELCRWMGARPDDFRSGAEGPETTRKRTAQSTPETIELYLRADKNLEPRTAELLAEMFKAAYEKLAKG